MSNCASEKFSLSGIHFNPKKGKRCAIDSDYILTNRNLQPLMEVIAKTNFITYRTKDAIPKTILKFLKCSASGTFTIANPGEKWQVTDIDSETLPERQLIFLDLNDSLVLMAHYTGGIGRAEHILIFKLKHDEIVDFWCGVSLQDLMNKEDVIKFIKENKDKQEGLNSNLVYF